MTTNILHHKIEKPMVWGIYNPESDTISDISASPAEAAASFTKRIDPFCDNLVDPDYNRLGFKLVRVKQIYEITGVLEE